jgi:two-component system LytT family sensor kinase
MKRLLITLSAALLLHTGFTRELLREHQTVIAYRFGKLNITLLNQFMRSTTHQIAPAYISLPAKEQVFKAYGPYLKIYVSELDHILKGQYSLNGFVNDTIRQDIVKMQLRNLQVQVTGTGGKMIQYWKDVLICPQNEDSLLFLPPDGYTVPMEKGPMYLTVQQLVLANEVYTVSFRDKKTRQELLQFVIQGMGQPIAPFLSMWTQDSSSSRTISAFIEREMAKKAYSLESINGFYKYWPGEYSGVLRNEKFYETSKLALYFRRPGPEYPDSSMEYRLLSESEKDTSWHITGHQLFITQLKSGNHYRLQIRYILHPGMIKEHSFFVAPKWYQTTRYRIGILVALLLLTSVIMLLVYRRRIRQSKEKMAKLHLEMKSLRAQLNPHFVFNAMSSIQALINKNEIGAANHYLTAFSSLLRESLQQHDKEMIPLVTEAKLLNTYLGLEKLRFGFSYEITIDSHIDANAVEIPASLIQPIAENAVKHGVAAIGEAGIIHIICTASAQDLMVSIIDNGKGFSPVMLSSGYGLKLTKDRISLLNKTLKGKSVDLSIDSSTNTGTTVHLRFRNWLSL